MRISWRTRVARKVRFLLFSHHKNSNGKKQNHTHTHKIDSKGQGDFGLGWNQIVSALVADRVLFNSQFNMESFLNKIPTFLNVVPKHSRPEKASIVNDIEKKSFVLKFPLSIERPRRVSSSSSSSDILHIVWPHRWEHDKGPDVMFRVLDELRENHFQFHISVLGESYAKIPCVFESGKKALGEKYIRHFGFVESREKYLDVLSTADIVLSTALHEFYGVSTLEAVWLGCLPICPNRLAYPEFFPKECLYNTERQLVKKLRAFCKNPSMARAMRDRVLSSLDMKPFHWNALKGAYADALGLD